jgi:oxaloacetate decarboxylase alpha subunit/pyruvate carboxylase subunit B
MILFLHLKKSYLYPRFSFSQYSWYGLASTLSAIIAGADIIDTNIFPFAGGPAAASFEIVYHFCKKLNIDVEANISVIPKLQEILMDIRKELKAYDQYPNNYPKMFDPQNPNLPTDIEKLFDNAIELTYKNKFDDALLVVSNRSIF